MQRRATERRLLSVGTGDLRCRPSPSRCTCPPYCGGCQAVLSEADGAEPAQFPELLTYCTLGTQAPLFRDIAPHHECFYVVPPVSYGLTAAGCTGYLIAFEWVGVQRTSVVSQPFFLGSPQRESAVSALPKIDFEPHKVDMNMAGVEMMVWSPEGGMGIKQSAAVSWTVTPALNPEGEQRFLKLLSGTSGFWSADALMRVRSVYSAYEAARSDASDPPPASVCPARVLYGAGVLCVDMPFIAGRDAKDEDLELEGGCAVQDVATGVAWLARHQLLYIDLRPPNVRVTENGVVLIDYDDVVVLQEPIRSFSDFCTALLNSDHVCAHPAANFVGSDVAWTPLGLALQALLG